MNEARLPIKPGYVETEVEGKRVYVASDNVKLLEALIKENELLKAQLQAQTDRSDFIEDCLAELAIQAYQ